jgi:hypothetical protein
MADFLNCCFTATACFERYFLYCFNVKERQEGRDTGMTIRWKNKRGEKRLREKAERDINVKKLYIGFFNTVQCD